MEIRGIGGINGPQAVYPRLAVHTVEAGASSAAAAPRDRVEISPLGSMLEGISRLPEIRQERVEEIRRQIAAGTYETPEKLEKALDNLLGELSAW